VKRSAAGRKGGASRSPAKAEAARANGKHGGRPRMEWDCIKRLPLKRHDRNLSREQRRRQLYLLRALRAAGIGARQGMDIDDTSHYLVLTVQVPSRSYEAACIVRRNWEEAEKRLTRVKGLLIEAKESLGSLATGCTASGSKPKLISRAAQS
jgi:hypothetical protein